MNRFAARTALFPFGSNATMRICQSLSMAANWPTGIGVVRVPAFDVDVVGGVLVVELVRDVDVVEFDVDNSL